MKPLRCLFGLHKWGKPVFRYAAGSNVKDWKKACQRCGKVKKWVEPVKGTDD